MRRAGDIKGFTLVELLVALVVTSVILSAVATLAFAMSTASHASGDTAAKQAQLRASVLRLQELVRNCRLICAAPDTDLAIWTTDDGDNLIDVNELVYVERGASRDTLRLCRFSSSDNSVIGLSGLGLSQTKAQLIAGYSESYVNLIPACSNVLFSFYDTNGVPLTVPGDPVTTAKRVTISLDLDEGDSIHHYEIDTTLRARAGYLLSPDGTALVSDDD